MENPVSAWRIDHTYFRSLLRLLQAEVDAFHAGERPNYDLMLDIVEYLGDFSARLHHPREEVAFQRLAAVSPDLQEVIARLSREHKILAQAGATLIEKLTAVLGGELMLRGEIEVAAATYLVYYGNHIALEEEAVLPRAEKVLTAADWQAVREAVLPAETEKAAQFFRALRRQISVEH